MCRLISSTRPTLPSRGNLRGGGLRAVPQTKNGSPSGLSFLPPREQGGYPERVLMMVTPADWVPGPLQGFWTYNDYAALPDDGRRYEIVSGVLIMAPAPSPGHQSITLRLSHYLFVHAE